VTGNVATQEILQAFGGSRSATAGRAEEDLKWFAELVWRISSTLRHETTSRVYQAFWACRERERQQAAHAKI
jgi:hypothetical protein